MFRAPVLWPPASETAWSRGMCFSESSMLSLPALEIEYAQAYIECREKALCGDGKETHCIYLPV